jgi:ribosome-binding factor A
MAARKPLRRLLRSLCAEVHDEDGVDPRQTPRDQGRKKSLRKSHQLCRQVFETLSDVLAGQNGDDRLRSLHVVSVVPAPDVSRLLVTLSPLPTERLDPAEVLERLHRASARLRCEVAAAITRRRVPILVFRLALGADSVARDGSTERSVGQLGFND